RHCCRHNEIALVAIVGRCFPRLSGQRHRPLRENGKRGEIVPFSCPWRPSSLLQVKALTTSYSLCIPPSLNPKRLSAGPCELAGGVDIRHESNAGARQCHASDVDTFDEGRLTAALDV